MKQNFRTPYYSEPFYIESNNSKYTLLLILVYALRIFSSIQDGISDRTFEHENIEIGWWAFHVMGWLCRDVIQAALLYWAGKEKGLFYLRDWLRWYAGHALANLLIHNILYWLTANNREYFLW